jgi:hypothetical protein
MKAKLLQLAREKGLTVDGYGNANIHSQGSMPRFGFNRYGDIFHANISNVGGCCGLGVAHGFGKNDDYLIENIDVWPLVTAVICDAAKERRFTAVMATDVERSIMCQIFEATGWELVDRYVNPNSNNMLNVYIRRVKDTAYHRLDKCEAELEEAENVTV